MSHGVSGLESAMGIWSRRKWLALAIFAAPFTGAAGLAAFLPDVYRAAATILVQQQQVAEALVKTSVTGELDTRLKTISQQILSRARLHDLIQRFKLYPEIDGGTGSEPAVERIRRDITLELKGAEEPDGRNPTIAFTIGYRGRDPRTVAGVANTLASFFVEEDQRVRQQQTSGTAEFLKVQLEEAKRRLEEQEGRISRFKDLHSGELPQQMQANLATMERFNTQLKLNSDAQIRAMDRRDALVKQIAEAGGPGAEGDPDGVAAKIVQLRKTLLDLRLRFRDRHPDVLRVQDEIDALQRQLADHRRTGETAGPAQAAPSDPLLQQLRRSIGRVDGELSTLRTEEKRLRTAIDGYQQRLETAPHREHELQEVSGGLATAKDLYESLLKRYQEAQIAENMEERQKGEQFRILDAAVVPNRPVGPNRLKLILAGLIVSCGLAAAIVCLAEQLDTSFRSVGDLRAFTRVPVLVRIPRIVTKADLRRRRLLAWGVSVPVALCLTGILGVSYMIATGNNPLLVLMALK